MLSPEDLNHFRERLLHDRAEIAGRIPGSDREVEETVHTEDGVGDVGDESQLLYDREQAIDDVESDRDALRRIDHALDRIAAGTYGVSEVSGLPIPRERLEAVPYATTLTNEPEPRDD
jgi:RNA polymerase-binding transcription factor DksA